MKKLKYLLFMIPILFGFMNNVKADETLDMANWVTASGRYWSISGLEYSTNKTFNADVLLNNFNVVGGLYIPPTDYDYVEWSYFERSASSYNPCGQSSFSIDLWFLFTNGSFVENVKSVRWGDTTCSITDRNSSTGRVYATCIVPYTTSTYNDIFIDYYEFTTNAGVSSDLYISRYNKVSCSLDTQSIITNNNINTDKIIDSNTEIKDTITDSNVTGVEDSFEQFEGFLEENSTITQLVTLPITLYTSILNNVGGTCQPFNLGSLYGENLVLPCVNIGNYLGATLWGMIDLIISGFAVYFISKKLIKVFNTFSSMKDGDVIDD